MMSVAVPDAVRRRLVALGALRAERVSDLVTTALQEYLTREFPEIEGYDFPERKVQASINLAGGLLAEDSDETIATG